jgi:hypothetical protein
MEEIKSTISALEEQCAELDSMDLEAVQGLLDSIQECYLDLIALEPKKSNQAKHKLWKVEFKRLNALVTKAEERENALYDLKFPKLKHYGELVNEPHDEREWVQLKREIDAWLAASGPEVAEEFDAQGYKEVLDLYCEGLNFEDEQAEPTTDVYKYSPIPCFMKYLPLLYCIDELWESFQLYVRSEFKDQGDGFFAFHREKEAMDIWQQVIEHDGGGLPYSIFAAGAYLIMRYKELGHDLDKELEALY